MRTARSSILQVSVIAVATALLATPAAATDGYFLHGVGAKAKGTGGVAIALPQEATSIATNPALATQLGHRADLGIDIFVPDRGATISGNQFGLNGSYSGNGANPFVLGDVAYVRPISDRVSAGIAIYANGGMNTVYKRNPFASLGATGKAGVDLKQAFITPTIAVEVADGQSLGVSAVAVVQTFRAYGIAPFSGASLDPANFTNRGNDWSTGFGFKVGYYGRLSDQLSVGAFYQSKIRASRFDKYAGLFEDRGDFDVPASFGVGVAVKPTKRLTVGVDYRRIQYSGVGSVGNSIALLFEGRPLGQKGGPGFGWRDINVYKVGAVWDVNDRLTLRAGYGRSGNPVPKGETLFNILAPGIVQDHLTIGVTHKVSDRVELSAHALRAFRNSQEGRGSIPASFGGGEADISLAETSFGLGLGLKF
ncbi:OmpP1/FadL family transporter [Sphingomonas jaspsi]|uniref:OmpP1/FadL family transporter n=1 Tax=Sphingomonas jaspsi TaxID=392409 RepID=UPI0009FC8183|nr:outer membrane protein transport protein [Sphingomonas jaspsi]